LRRTSNNAPINARIVAVQSAMGAKKTDPAAPAEAMLGLHCRAWAVR
jgi:hypothetical protein